MKNEFPQMLDLNLSYDFHIDNIVPIDSFIKMLALSYDPRFRSIRASLHIMLNLNGEFGLNGEYEKLPIDWVKHYDSSHPMFSRLLEEIRVRYVRSNKIDETEFIEDVRNIKHG